jgi:hypothetical protein
MADVVGRTYEVTHADYSDGYLTGIDVRFSQKQLREELAARK